MRDVLTHNSPCSTNIYKVIQGTVLDYNKFVSSSQCATYQVYIFSTLLHSNASLKCDGEMWDNRTLMMVNTVMAFGHVPPSPI